EDQLGRLILLPQRRQDPGPGGLGVVKDKGDKLDQRLLRRVGLRGGLRTRLAAAAARQKRRQQIPLEDPAQHQQDDDAAQPDPAHPAEPTAAGLVSAILDVVAASSRRPPHATSQVCLDGADPPTVVGQCGAGPGAGEGAGRRTGERRTALALDHDRRRPCPRPSCSSPCPLLSPPAPAARSRRSAAPEPRFASPCSGSPVPPPGPPPRGGTRAGSTATSRSHSSPSAGV